MFGKLDRYLLRLTLTPLLATLGVAVLLLVLEQMLRLFDFVLSSDGPVAVVWRMLAFLVPQYFGLALPLGLLIGIMFAFRKLSTGSELDAILSSGVSLRRLLLTLFGLAGAMMVLNLAIVGFVQPISHYQYAKLKHEVRTGALGFSIRIGEFVTIGDNTVLRIGEAPDAEGRFGDVFLETCTEAGDCATVSAASGLLQPTEENGLKLTLFNGRQIAMQRPNGEDGPLGRFVPGAITFAQQEITVDLPDLQPFRERGADQEEVTLPELMQIVATETPESFEDYHAFRANMHWRILHTLSFLALPLLALPMGIANKRKDTGLAPIAAIVCLVVYNELTEAGRRQTAMVGDSPWLTMWPLFFLFLGFCFIIYRRRAEQGSFARGHSWLGDTLYGLTRPIRNLMRKKQEAETGAITIPVTETATAETGEAYGDSGTAALQQRG